MYFVRDAWWNQIIITDPGVQWSEIVVVQAYISPVNGDIVLALANWVRHILKLLVDASVSFVEFQTA